MIQHDLFSPATGQAASVKVDDVDLRTVLDRLATISARPRYAFMVLNLIAKIADKSGRAGPYVRDPDGPVPVRDWLCDALTPMAQRKPQRLALIESVRKELAGAAKGPADPAEAEAVIKAEVQKRVRKSGRGNVSRAVSELVRAGLLTRHYQGYRVDHQNRGAQRQAVYIITNYAQEALGGNRGSEPYSPF